MANAIAKLAAQLQLDSNAFNATLNAAERRAQQFSNKIDKIGGNATDAAFRRVTDFSARKANIHHIREAAQPLLFQMKGGAAGLAANRLEDFRRDRLVQREFNRQRFGAVGGGIMNARDSLGMAMAGPVGMAAAGGLAVAGGMIASAKIGDPKAFEVFSKAVMDLIGVIGQRAGPIVELWGEQIRLFADLLNTILPSGDEFRTMLEPFMEILRDHLRPALQEIAPLLKDVVGVGFKMLALGIKVTAEAIKFFIDFMLDTARLLASLVPKFMRSKEHQAFIAGGKAPDLKSSVGAAVDTKGGKAASIGSIEDLARGNWLAAMNDPARQQTNLLTNIDRNIQVIAQGALAGAAAGRSRDQVNRGLQQGTPQ